MDPRRSTSGSGSPTATRSSPRGAWPARRAPRRRLGRLDRVGRAGDREAARARRARPDDAARQRPRLPLEVLRRQVDARARLPRADGAAADGRRGAAVKRGEDAGRARPRHDREPPEGRRGDRPDAALLDLAAAGGARRAGRVARGRRRLAARARAPRPRVQEPRCAPGGRCRRRCSRRSPQWTSATRSTRSSPTSPAARTRSSWRAAGRPAAILTRSDLLEYLAHRRSEHN